MTVLESGLLGKDGIVVHCPACGCVYMIESADDWGGGYQSFFDIDKYENGIYETQYYHYAHVCPECGYEKWFGFNHNDNKAFLKQSVFDRPDFKERYSKPVIDKKL